MTLAEIVNESFICFGLTLVGLCGAVNLRTFEYANNWFKEKEEWLESHKGMNHNDFKESFENYINEFKNDNSAKKLLYYIGYPGTLFGKYVNTDGYYFDKISHIRKN